MGIADEFADAFKSATRDLHKDKKRRERDARRRYRVPVVQAAEQVTLKDAVYEVMVEAVEAAGGGGALPFSARTLYYQVRPRIQEIVDDRELDYSYFTQTLLVQYQEDHGRLAGLYYEPRGVLHEPHTGTKVAVGAKYEIHDWTFDKVLYVEKSGLWPVLEAARLAERFDLAIIVGNGYPTEACRSLLATAEDRDVSLFCLHDADPDGYNIARVLAEETRRMPGHCVDVIDLGLTVADAKAQGLPTERFTRRKRLPWSLELDTEEREWFVGQLIGYGKQHVCTRVELNAFTGPDLIAYVERKLGDHGAAGKLIPPQETIDTKARALHRARLDAQVVAAVLKLADTDKLVDKLVEETKAAAVVDPADIAEAFDDDRELSWRQATEDKVDEGLDYDKVRERLKALLAERGMGA